jgi:hypothetical protein
VGLLPRKKPDRSTGPVGLFPHRGGFKAYPCSARFPGPCAFSGAGACYLLGPSKARSRRWCLCSSHRRCIMSPSLASVRQVVRPPFLPSRCRPADLPWMQSKSGHAHPRWRVLPPHRPREFADRAVLPSFIHNRWQHLHSRHCWRR